MCISNSTTKTISRPLTLLSRLPQLKWRQQGRRGHGDPRLHHNPRRGSTPCECAECMQADSLVPLVDISVMVLSLWEIYEGLILGVIYMVSDFRFLKLLYGPISVNVN